ncbi:MAG: VOC family protein [Firmicutes bacterium]|nr:VOC family protein [Bacillota bacterium]
MAKFICTKCTKVFSDGNEGAKCPQCGAGYPEVYEIKNSDELLRKEVDKIMEEREKLGISNLIGGLECVIINTERRNQKKAAQELVSTTGLEYEGTVESENYHTCILRQPGNADFLIRARRHDCNPFREINKAVKTAFYPNTRLETLVFKAKDLEKFVEIQQERGVKFMTEDVIHYNDYNFIQTMPSQYTGNSIGFIEWLKEDREYFNEGTRRLEWDIRKPDRPHLKNIGKLDHCATRVKCEDRDAAICEFLSLTNYHFDFAIYVDYLNSITNVARLSDNEYAMVFTAGISPYESDEKTGPTEKFVHNYGHRVHHMAFLTENIEDTYENLKKDGMGFLVELVGSEDEGLKQTFSQPSEYTLLVNEYIKRYGDFDGFFTKSNVTLLTAATDNQ